jgi:hypothetical protein
MLVSYENDSELFNEYMSGQISMCQFVEGRVNESMCH